MQNLKTLAYRLLWEKSVTSYIHPDMQLYIYEILARPRIQFSVWFSVFPCKILRAVIGRYGYSSWFFYLCSYWSESYSFWGQAGPRVCLYSYSIHCTKHLYSRITLEGHSWRKHCSWLNLARIKKKRAPCFLTFCYSSKNERAKAFPSFSHGLHLKRTWPRYYSSLALGRGGYIYAQ